MNSNDAYSIGLDRNPANYAPLTPISFLHRAAAVYPDRLSVVHGEWRCTWRETYARCRRLASALARRGVGRNDTVAILAPNIPAMVEAHFGVPMCGAVLNTLNTRLDAGAIAFMLRHGGARVLLTDREFAPVVEQALAATDKKIVVIDIDDPAAPDGRRLGEMDYEGFLLEGDPGYEWQSPPDEWDAISLNYTSGTTGDPKGVVSHHRGAYLNALSNIVGWGMTQHPVYLWTLPLFHCNGWCFPWSVAALAGVNVCLRRVEAGLVLDAIRKHHVTHMCGAPIVYSMLVNAPAEMRAGITHRIAGQIAAAAPPPALLEGAEQIGIDLTHVYGLTETYGPAAVCAKHESWAALPLEKRADLNSRQGVRAPLQEAMVVLDPENMKPVPCDGETMGEIMFRGNIVMKGYLKNPEATQRSFAGGWFHTGDLAVVHPDGYVKIRDRSKDIIISGGENISSLEVEEVLFRHPAVLYAAVVAKPDPKWGETPCAFIELKPGATVTADELTAYCRDNLAHYKVPKYFAFHELPKTSTGKIQKFALREKARAVSSVLETD
ncbi:MAG: acyl-CoA synthetase [Acetobacteraceae bacterium]|nr:acyl-CoA synthetase [Acetobacteraceae bacterium]MBV8522263.1 acyl-CoA synthetase [Acetobacteraceae bacterium]